VTFLQHILYMSNYRTNQTNPTYPNCQTNQTNLFLCGLTNGVICVQSLLTVYRDCSHQEKGTFQEHSSGGIQIAERQENACTGFPVANRGYWFRRLGCQSQRGL